MNNKELFQNTFSQLKVSDEKRKELVTMSRMVKPKRKFRLTKMAVAVACFVLVLAGGTVAYAVSDGRVFNDLGHWLRADVFINEERQEAQVTKENSGDFIIKYGDQNNGGEIKMDGKKDSTVMVLDIDFLDEEGNEASDSKVLQIDKTASYEDQLWQIREQMLPLPNTQEDDVTLSDNYVATLQKAAEKLEGVWKEGILLSIGDIKKVKSGRKIFIDGYEFEKTSGETEKRTSWLYIDYTDVKLDSAGKAEFNQMSDAGYKAEFKITLESGEIREWVPVEIYK